MPHIPIYQLSYQEFTLRYGLFREEIQDLIDNPDRRVPTHHQVDPRVIEVHLGLSTAPTFHIGSQEYSLISRHYREYYLNWLAAVDANNQSIQQCSQGLQAGLDCWRNRYASATGIVASAKLPATAASTGRHVCKISVRMDTADWRWAT